MEGLAKLADTEIDYDKVYHEKLYNDHPDLDQLRLNELAADEQYEKDNTAYQEARKPSVSKGMMKGLGIGGGIGLLPGAFTRNPGLATAGTIGGGLLGSMVGGSIADSRFQKTSPLYQQRSESLDKAIDAQDAHVNRWLELAYPDEYKEAGDRMEGLAKVADVVELFGNQRNRLKAGTNPKQQNMLELDNMLSNMESELGEMQQRNDDNLQRTNQLLGNKDEPSEARQQIGEILRRNRNEFGQSDYIQRGLDNVEKLKTEGQQLHQKINQMDSLFNRVGQLDNLKQQVHARNVRQGLIAGGAGLGLAGAGLAGAVYAAKHRQHQNKEAKEMDSVEGLAKIAGLDQVRRVLEAEAKAKVKRSPDAVFGNADDLKGFSNEIKQAKGQINQEFRNSGMTSEQFGKYIRPQVANITGGQGENWASELSQHFPVRNFLKK